MNNKQLSLGCIAVLSLIVGACDRSGPEPIVELRPVRSIIVTVSGAESVYFFSGSTQAELDSTLSFRVAGNITENLVDVGQEVDAGQLLSRIDPKDYQVQRQEAMAGLAQANAELRNAEARYERTRGLYENRNASKADLDAARAASESAGAQVRAANQQLEATQLQLSYTRLLAPELCSVAEIFAIENENVSPGQPVIRLTCGSCAEAAVSVSETLIGNISNGMNAEIVIAALDNQVFAGVVKEVGVAPSGASSAYPVTVSFVENCDQVRAGMAVDVRIAVATANPDTNIRVPLVAVGEDREGHYVFSLVEAGDHYVASRRSVRTGDFDRSGMEIIDGLAVGERIATAGVRRLVDGQQVRLLTNDQEPQQQR
ncbi:MAG: efflux RND transporter periplasmic adaptor subunit [Gammaproteobacteria bacterium]|nr:efflux RND transporter periplasmic adaptor subunit [Gammaproteobacteria bacterium]